MHTWIKTIKWTKKGREISFAQSFLVFSAFISLERNNEGNMRRKQWINYFILVDKLGFVD